MRQVGINAQRRSLLHAKELCARARSDVIANISVSRRDNTSEWYPDDFECFERFKLIDVGLVCYYYGLVLSIGASRSIIVLRSSNLPVEKFLLAPPGYFRQVKRCLCNLELSLRWLQLMVDL